MTVDYQEDILEVETTNERTRKSVFVKGKIHNLTKRIYSIIIWEGVWITGPHQNRMDFLRADFSLSSFAYDSNKLKHSDSISKYLEAIKNSRMETLSNFTKNYSMLQKSIDKEFNNLDMKTDESQNIRSFVSEIESIIEKCYKELFFGSQFNFKFSHDIYDEDEVVSAKIINPSSTDEEEHWQVPPDAEVVATSPVIEPNTGIPSHDLSVGDKVWFTPLNSEGLSKGKDPVGVIRQIMHDENHGYRFLIDLEEDTFGDMEVLDNLNIRATKKNAGLDGEKKPSKKEVAEEMLEENKIENQNYGFAIFGAISLLVLTALFYLFFIQ